MSYAERIRSTHKRAVDDKNRDPAVAFEAGLLTALGIAIEADSEIERLRAALAKVARYTKPRSSAEWDGGEGQVYKIAAGAIGDWPCAKEAGPE